MQEFQVGDFVELVGGFHDGFRGEVVKVEHGPAVLDPAGVELVPELERYTVRISDGRVDVDCGGIHPVNIIGAEPCPYCGRGRCRGTALTAGGRDLERFAAVHPARGVPERFPHGKAQTRSSSGRSALDTSESS